MFKYIFFDLDGTLTDPAQGIINSFIHALKYFGVEIPSYETLCTFIGPPLVDTFKTQFGFDEEKAQLGVKKYREYFADKGLFENSVYPGIESLLKELISNGKHLIVATSKPEEYSIRILEKFGLSKYFQHICGSNMDETRSKKDEVIKYALDKAGISDNSSVLMIGDRMHDIIGAHAHNIKVCAVMFGYGNLEEFKLNHADYIANNIEELKYICLEK